MLLEPDGVVDSAVSTYISCALSLRYRPTPHTTLTTHACYGMAGFKAVQTLLGSAVGWGYGYFSVSVLGYSARVAGAAWLGLCYVLQVAGLLLSQPPSEVVVS